MSLHGKKIILGVSGSIAAYKSAFLVRSLVKAGAEVQVVMTAAAEDFITPVTMATLSKRPCLRSFINADGSDWNNHVELGLWADALVVAPATAATLSRMANGLCDNLLTGVYLSARCPVFIAPAMDEDMWAHPSTQSNIERLRSFGNTIIPVGSGELASGLVGAGRMAEPETILEALGTAFSGSGPKKKQTSRLTDKRLLITAGPTYEPLDPVRFIGNHSTGKMGIALAEAAAARGARVTLVLGPTSLSPGTDAVDVIRVTTGDEMYRACSGHFPQADVCIFAAAVADYAAKDPSGQKIKKSEGDLTLELRSTRDIARSFGEVKKPGQISVGFALETEKELQYAKQKLEKKNFDLVVLNSLRDKGAGFRHDTNKVTIIGKDNNILDFELKPKDAVAGDILDSIEELL